MARLVISDMVKKDNPYLAIIAEGCYGDLDSDFHSFNRFASLKDGLNTAIMYEKMLDGKLETHKEMEEWLDNNVDGGNETVNIPSCNANMLPSIDEVKMISTIEGEEYNVTICRQDI